MVINVYLNINPYNFIASFYKKLYFTIYSPLAISVRENKIYIVKDARNGLIKFFIFH